MTVNDQWFAAASAEHLEKVAALADEAVERAERRVEKVRAELAAAEESLGQAQRDAEQASADAAKARGVAGDEAALYDGEQVAAQADVAQMKTES